MSVNFTATGPVQGRYDTPDQQNIQGTDSTTWGDSWGTAVDNSDIPVTNANGDTVGYVDARQATQMKALEESGYTITGPNGEEVTVGEIDSENTDAGDVSTHFDNEFSSWLNITPSDNVTPQAVLDKVQDYFPGVSTVDEAIQIILRNSNYEGAAHSEQSRGVGNQAGGNTVNFFRNGQRPELTRLQGAMGVTVYQQDRSTGAMSISRPPEER